MLHIQKYNLYIYTNIIRNIIYIYIYFCLYIYDVNVTIRY